MLRFGGYGGELRVDFGLCGALRCVAWCSGGTCGLEGAMARRVVRPALVVVLGGTWRCSYWWRGRGAG